MIMNRLLNNYACSLWRVAYLNTSFIISLTLIKKKLNKPEIALRLCEAPQCTKLFVEIGCLGTDNAV